MHFHEWVKEEKGRATFLAKHFGVTRGAVSQWLRNGVPLKHLRSIRVLSKDQVRAIEDIVPPEYWTR